MEKATLLKVARVKRGFKATAVAERLGISPSKFYFIENGQQSCPADIGYELAKIYGIEVSELFEPTRLKTIYVEEALDGKI